MRLLVGLGAIGAALAGGLALAAPHALSERFDRPPVRSEAGDLRFRDFVFWRDRNPNGVAMSRRRGPEGADGMVRLRVTPGLSPATRLGDSDRCDRAELREAPEHQLAYGTPVSYGFSMRLSEGVFRSTKRLVVAQIKSPATHLRDPSPIFALRVIDGGLLATIEFERRRGDETLFRPRATDGGCDAGYVPAYLHRAGQVRVAVGSSGAGAPAWFGHCTRAVKIETLSLLPDLRGRWGDLAVHIRPGPTGDGRLTISADGRPVAVVRGRLGHRMEAGRQFFKIGPYRDRDDTQITIDVDNLRRGGSPEVVSRPPPKDQAIVR